jgi:hypothetical protein
VTITTSAKTDGEALALLEAFGMPFARDGRGPQVPGADSATAPAEENPTESPEAGEELIAEVEALVGSESAAGGEPVAGTGAGGAEEPAADTPETTSEEA